MKETHEHAVKRGKKSRKAGKDFENLVKKDLETKGCIVLRWDKNVEFGYITDDASKSNAEKFIPVKWKDLILQNGENYSNPVGRLVTSKPKFNPFTKSIMMNSSGFPDYICLKIFEYDKEILASIKLIECKINGKLDKEEQEKCNWIKNNLKILVEVAFKEGREIKYKGWNEK